MVRYAAVVAMCLCSVLASTRPAEAQYFGRNKVHYDRLDFRVLQTEHFDVYYYAEEEAATRHAARMAERWYSRLSRVLGHTFSRRQPLVLYASHPHFSQTNLTPGSPGEGTGGFTERTKSRIAMPFAAGLGETDHVLGHEIAHAFQIDIAASVKQNAFSMPGWFIEGMAEYLSLGGANTHTEMWVRDAALHDRLPTLKQLDNPRIFPYRFGHALWAFLAERHGDGVMSQVLRSKARGGVIGRLEEVTGLDAEQLTRAWHASIAASADRSPTVGARAVEDDRRARMHLAPALSPDGSRLMFVSERDRLSLDVFMADVESGAVLQKIVSTAADPHFDSLQYIHSAGAWAPDGRHFAMTVIGGGEPLLVIVDVTAPAQREEIRLPGLSEAYNASWSPDGARVVFSGLKGGLSDLFIYSRESGTVMPLTADAYADFHPAWSPDGRTIAFATDRFTSSLDALRFGPLRVALLDLASGIAHPLVDGTGVPLETPARAKQVSPQWAPDGTAVYFVSDRSGISNVYRAQLTTGELRQVTSVAGGISGITATSPALAVASQAGTVAFSVYEDGRYEIRTLREREAMLGRRVDSEPQARQEAPATSPAAASIAELLANPADGLPSGATFTSATYDDRLQLESVSQPFVGAATGNAFGGAVRASFGVTFGDLLRDRQLQTLFRVGTDVDDLAAQIAYTNRREQWNWGVTAGFLPSRFYGARRAIESDGELVTRTSTNLRYMHQWGGLRARYNINRAQRLELGAGVRRTGFAWQTIRRVLDADQRKEVSRELDESAAGRPMYLSEAQVAFVHDTAVFGATSPVLGQRLRLEVEPAFGGASFADVRVDARRYFMPVRPVTIAARVEHVGRYGAGATDTRLTPLVVGLQSLVRGYDLRTFAADECGRSATECSLMDQLTGSRFALFNLEVRAPLFGLFSGDLEYGPVPIEAIAFVDAGFLWTRHASAAIERDRFRSVGAGARANLAGLVFEVTAARPFDRPRNGWTLSFLVRPGW